MIIPSFTQERKLLNTYNYIAGVDEVGRGPLAGPVVAAVVILNPEKLGEYRNKAKWWRDIRDSKMLSASKREDLGDAIKENSVDFAIGSASNQEIDELNIHYATFLAMRRALENLEKFPEMVLIDGKFTLPGISSTKQTAIVDGDAKILSIACASILAKVYRDDLMTRYAELNSNFGFEKNKGYATSFHRKKILQHGPCVIHRMSFSKIQDIMNERFGVLTGNP